jgi:hypothetical protein
MISGDHDPVTRQLQLLLIAYGYNCYKDVLKARADDLLVRERSSHFLAQAADMFSFLKNAFLRRFIYPLKKMHDEQLKIASPDSKSHIPQPGTQQIQNAQDLQPLIDDLDELHQLLVSLDIEVRGLKIPTQTRIWWRIQQNHSLLQQLLHLDLDLVRGSEHISQYISQLTPEQWRQEGSQVLRKLIQQLEGCWQQREQLLCST